MMDVQLMRRIVDPVRDGQMPTVVGDAVGRWHGAKPEYFRSSANHIFRCERDGIPVFLRLSNVEDHTREAVQAELDFVLYSGDQGVRVARPVVSDGGNLVEEVPGYLAVVFEALVGQQFEAEDLDAGMTRAWGRALGQLHRASMAYPGWIGRGEWIAGIDELRAWLPCEERALRDRLDAGRAWLAALPDQPYGLIHGDFELDNLVRDGEEFHVLDFDDLSYGPLAADIAIAAADIHAEPARLDQFLEGYGEVIPLPDGVRDQLPGFLGLNQAIKIARLMRAYANTSGDDQPEWVIAMRARHSAWLAERKAVLA